MRKHYYLALLFINLAFLRSKVDPLDVNHFYDGWFLSAGLMDTKHLRTFLAQFESVA